MVYNLTPVWNANNTIDMMTSASDVSNSNLFVFIGLTIWIVTFVIFMKGSARIAWLASSFLSMMFMIMFYALGYIAFHILILPILMLFVSIFIVLFMQE